MAAAPRIVSLVPSITELVCALGLIDSLVGRTGFCVHPRGPLRRIAKVGGTKDLQLDRIRALAPTHVIVNQEENRREDYDALCAFVPEVIVTYPQGPDDNIALYRDLGARFDRAAQAEHLVDQFQTALTAARAATARLPIERVLYLIWRAPWMSVGADTYIARTLAAVGWQTVATAVDTLVDTAAATTSIERYPKIELIAAAGSVDRVLLSTEPYRFSDAHCVEIEQLCHRPTLLIDGEMTSWYGSRAITGLAYLANLRVQLSHSPRT